ncbi:MAG: VanZ family protein, partial [Oscillospiraceae bacterium]
ILNVFMFVPFGFMLPILWKRANLLRVVLIGFLSSLFIEFVQGFMYRDSTIDDIVCNTLGALLGYILYLLIKRLFPNFVAKAKRWGYN